MSIYPHAYNPTIASNKFPIAVATIVAFACTLPPRTEGVRHILLLFGSNSRKI